MEAGGTVMNEELFQLLKRALQSHDVQACWASLKDFKDAGGAQGAAYVTLERLRGLEHIEEGELFDVMEFAWGSVRREREIWPGLVNLWDPVAWRTTSEILLKVAGYQMHNGRLGLLPGVSQQTILDHGLGGISQGSLIELRLPDGRFRVTCIADYFVDISTNAPAGLDVSNLSIIVCVPHGYDPVSVPIGTEVRLAEFL